MRKYRQLTIEDRIYIEVLHWERKSQREIAMALGVHPSTISRELQRGQEKRQFVSYEAIYQYIKRDRQAGGRLYLHLRRGHRRVKDFLCPV